jgi:hypothetical protein
MFLYQNKKQYICSPNFEKKNHLKYLVIKI